jgi:hypothetical protein
MSIDEVIQKIDGYIEEIIDKQIDSRMKRVDMAKSVAGKIKQCMVGANYIVRLGQIFRPYVKVELENMKNTDISKPRMTLSYKGKFMSLVHQDGMIAVPQIDVFVYEPVLGYNIISETSVESLRRSIMVRFDITRDIAEGADVEDTYNKYIYLDIDWIGESTISTDDRYKGYVIENLAGYQLKIDHFEGFRSVGLKRTVTIDGESTFYLVEIHNGKLFLNLYDWAGNKISGGEAGALFVHCFTDKLKKATFIILGQALPQSETSGGGGGMYSTDAYITQKDGSLVMHIVRR